MAVTHSNHHAPVFDSEHMRWFMETIQHQIPKQDTIVTCGIASNIIAGILHYQYQRPICLVRKPGEKTRAFSSSSCIGPMHDIRRWWFVDDLVSVGVTLQHAIDMVGSVPRGVLCYARNVPLNTTKDIVRTLVTCGIVQNIVIPVFYMYPDQMKMKNISRAAAQFRKKHNPYYTI